MVLDFLSQVIRSRLETLDRQGGRAANQNELPLGWRWSVPVGR
jgi:hypothetical protein